MIRGLCDKRSLLFVDFVSWVVKLLGGKAGKSGRWARWSKYIANTDELEAIMEKGCKGSVTELTKVAARTLYENTYKTFGPGHENHLKYKQGAKKPYSSTGTIANTISINKTSRDEDDDDAFTNSVYFDENKIENKKTRKSHDYLPRYDDVSTAYGDSFSMPEFIDALEHGTEISEPRMMKFSRKETGFIEKTEKDIRDFINSSEMDFIIEKNMEISGGDIKRAGITITRHK